MADAVFTVQGLGVTAEQQASDGANDAINRMRRAHGRGTGCYLTAEMIASLGLTIIAEIWSQPDPRKRIRAVKGKGRGMWERVDG